MSVRMTVMVEYVGITSAMLAKDRLQHIIGQDRNCCASYRWVKKPPTSKMYVCGGYFGVHLYNKKRFRWERRP